MINKKKDKRGVFGLTAIQSFFATILGIALLAYVIVIIMGTLSTSSTTILVQAADGSVVNETGASITTLGYTFAQAGVKGFGNPTILQAINTTSATIISSGNYTITNGRLFASAEAIKYVNWSAVSITYTYKHDSQAQNNLDSILGNTSTGITGFFSSISPVYAILAVLVIILVLVVLVRVVQAPNRGETSPQL